MDNRWIIAIVIAGLLAVGGYLYYSEGATVSAQGFSSVTVQPDEVSVYATIETKDSNLQTANNKNSEITDKVVMELIKLGFEKKDIQLVNYNTYPDYEWTDGTQKMKGYVVNRQIIVKTEDFEKVSDIVNAIVGAGALVYSINFEISNEKQSMYKQQALEEASKDARTKAESTAAGLGKNLGRLVSVESQDFNYGGPIMYYARDAASGVSAEKAAADIAPREMDVTASVSVRYKLGWF